MGPAWYTGPKWPEIGSIRPKFSKFIFFMIFQPKTSKKYAEISSSHFGTIFGHFGPNGPFWPWCPNFRSCYRAEMKSATPKTPTYQISEGSGGGAWETVLAPLLIVQSSRLIYLENIQYQTKFYTTRFLTNRSHRPHFKDLLHFIYSRSLAKRGSSFAKQLLVASSLLPKLP